MTRRLNILARKSDGIDGLVAVEAWIAKSFDPKLMELVKVRVSQINGCVHCLHMHRQDALKQGETEERVLLLSAWRKSQLYSDRERAALAWAKSLTNIAESRAPDALFGRRTPGAVYRHRHDQCLEPAGDRLSAAASGRPQARRLIAERTRTLRADSSARKGPMQRVCSLMPASSLNLRCGRPH